VKLSQRRLGRPSVGGLLATRQGSLTLAVLCAICAAGILMFALGRYKSNLKTTVQQATALVATGEIKKGTPGTTVASQNLYKVTPVAATQLAPGAITNAAQLSGETAQADILPGQQLVAGDFSSVVGITGVLQPNQRAVAVTVDEVHGITDALQAGDHVDVYVDIGSNSSASGGGGAAVILLEPDVLVLKPAGAPVHIGGTAIVGASMLLAVDSDKVAEFTWANDNAKFYLTLRPTNSGKTPGAAITSQTLIKTALKAYDPSALNSIVGSTTKATTTGATP
jgi:Flp pilus assembly protein CpaB